MCIRQRDELGDLSLGRGINIVTRDFEVSRKGKRDCTRQTLAADDQLSGDFLPRNFAKLCDIGIPPQNGKYLIKPVVRHRAVNSDKLPEAISPRIGERERETVHKLFIKFERSLMLVSFEN